MRGVYLSIGELYIPSTLLDHPCIGNEHESKAVLDWTPYQHSAIET